MDFPKCAGLNQIWQKRELFALLTVDQEKPRQQELDGRSGDEEIEEVDNITNITTAFGWKTGSKMRIYEGFRRGSYKHFVAVIRCNFVFTLG